MLSLNSMSTTPFSPISKQAEVSLTPCCSLKVKPKDVKKVTDAFIFLTGRLIQNCFGMVDIVKGG